MKTIIRRKLAAEKAKILQRLDDAVQASGANPMLAASNIHYEVAQKTSAIAHGGIGAIHLLVRKTGLAKRIDEKLHLLKVHAPYHESDHVLNIAYNPMRRAHPGRHRAASQRSRLSRRAWREEHP